MYVQRWVLDCFTEWREAQRRGEQLAAALRPPCMHQRHISAETAGVVTTRMHFQPHGRRREISGRGAAAVQAKWITLHLCQMADRKLWEGKSMKVGYIWTCQSCVCKNGWSSPATLKDRKQTLRVESNLQEEWIREASKLTLLLFYFCGCNFPFLL